jgi:hypothetical protein
MFLGITIHVLFTLPWEVSDQKYPKDILWQKHVLTFIQKGNKTFATPDYLLIVLCLLWS